MVLDATTKVFTSAASNQGPFLLSVAREFEDFALRYAETHLNDSNETLTFETNALGGLLFQTIKTSREINQNVSPHLVSLD